MTGELPFEKSENIRIVIEHINVIFSLSIDEVVDRFDIVKVTSPNEHLKLSVLGCF